MKKTLLFSLLFIAMLAAVSAAETSSASKSEVKSQFITFEKEADLYYLLYEAKLAGIIDEDGNFDEDTFTSVVSSQDKLYNLAVEQGIIVLGQFSSAGLKKYVDSDLALRNMLVRCGVLDSQGKFSQSGLASLLSRYNPTTKELDPLPEKTIEEEKKEEDDDAKRPVTQPLGEFRFETIRDVYEFVLKAYQAGMFDKEGNFIETSFANMMKGEPRIAEILQQNDIIDELFKVNYGVLTNFINARPALASMLREANIYRNGEYSKKAVSDIIFRYNEQTGKLDLQPTLPVVSQIELDSSEENEVISNQLDVEEGFDGMTLKDALAKLQSDPVVYLRDFIVYLRRYAIFSSDGYFDSFMAYQTLYSDNAAKDIIDKYKIYEGTTFKPENLLKLVNSLPDLKKACDTLGIFSDGHYSQETVAAIVQSYKSPLEQDPVPFNVMNPLTAQTTDDVMTVLGRAYTLGILDKDGQLDIGKLQDAMEDSDKLMTSIASASILQGNVFSVPSLRMAIISHPMLRSALCELGILDSYGELDKTTFIRAIARAAKLSLTPLNSPQADTEEQVATDRDRTTAAENVLSEQKTPLTATDVVNEAAAAAQTVTYQTTGAFKGAVDRSRKIVTSVVQPQEADLQAGKNTTAKNDFNWGVFWVVFAAAVVVVVIIVAVVVLVKRRGKSKRDDSKEDDQFHLV